jgi:hypothetical protein
MSPAPDLDGLLNADLKRLVLELLGRVADLERLVAAQREEIARLKGLKGRPPIKPSGMDSQPPPPGSGHTPGRKKPKASQLAIHEERIIPAAVPAGSRFKGYEDFLIQDLIVRPHGVRIRRERWLTPDGRTIVAPLPSGILGHFGPDLHRYVLALYHQGQLTIPRLVEHLMLLGVLISKRQVVRLLGDASGLFRQEATAVLRAGLMTARWITVDDTGARHQGRTGSCTQIGNDHFTWFGTTTSKNRLNFLELLRASYPDYVVNAEALSYMRRRALPEPLIAGLAHADTTHFCDTATWQRHLQQLAMPSRPDTLDPVRLATEGAVWGSIKAHGLLPNTVIVSDDAGQFEVGEHALCWVHAERLIHQLDTFTDHQRAAQKRMRMLIWWFYRDLKLYRQEPSGRRRTELRRRFDRIFAHRTGFATLDRLLGRLQANKAELLRVLDRPEIPLHTNGSENDIRAQVIRRKISAGTRSDIGRDCRDAFLGLSKTCRKLGLSFWDYLGDRLRVANAPAVPRLADLVSARCSPA